MSSSDSDNETTNQSRDDSSDAEGPFSPKRRKISEVQDQASTSTQENTSDEYDQAGLTKTYHGVMYQLAHYMLIIERASKLKYTFKLAKEMEPAENFDDLVFEYKPSGSKKLIHKFVQFKHRAPETEGSQRITANDLLDVDDGDYSLLKYFESYRKIQKRDEFANSESKVYILCTNRGMEDEEALKGRGINVELAEVEDELMGIVSDPNGEGPRCYRLKAEPQDNSGRYGLFKSLPDRHRLAQELAEHVCQNKKLTLLIPIFREHHRSLTSEVIVINTKKKTMRFNDDFIHPAKRDKLTEEAKKFRDIFWSHVEKSTEYKDFNNRDKFFEKLKHSEYQITENFGKGDRTELPDVASDKDIENFLKNFIIAVWQPNERQITEKMGEMMGEEFKLLDVEFLMGYFHKEISDWFKEAGRKGKYFNEKKARTMIRGIRKRIKTLVSVGLNLCYNEELKSCEISFRSADAELEKFLQPDSEFRKPLELYSATKTLLTALMVYDTIKTVTRYKMKDSYIFIKLKQLKRKWILDCVSSAWIWPKDQRLLVVDCGADRDKKYARKLLNPLIRSANEPSKKLILISQNTGDSTMSADATSFKNLDSKSQGRILENPIIKFQGSNKLTSLSKLLAIDEPHNLEEEDLDKISEMINSDGLVQLICAQRKNNSVSVGSEQMDNEWSTIRDYYIPRTLIRHETVDSGVFRDSKIKDRFAITGINEKELRMLMDNEQGLWYKGTTASMNLNNCIFLRDQQPAHHFEDLCKEKQDANIHWLDYIGSGKFTWKKTHGDVTKLNEYRKQNSPTPRNEEGLLDDLLEIDLHDLDHRTVIVNDIAGTGKSTMLTHLVGSIKKEGNPPVFVIKVILRQFLDALEKQHTNPLAPRKFLVENLSGLSEDFEKRVLETMIERKNNVVVMFDGIDEIELKYRNLVVELLKELRVTKLFVTTRPESIETLERDLKTYSYELERFNRKHQIDFLCKFWGREKPAEESNDRVSEELKDHAENVIHLLEKSVDERMNEFLGVPLQTKLVAEVYEEVGSELDTEKIDVNALFRRFMKKKLQIRVKKEKNKDGSTRSELDKSMIKDNRLKFRKAHQELAMKALFETDALLDFRFQTHSNMKDLKLLASAGIFTLIKNRVQFNHMAYAEHLAAQFIFDKMTDSSGSGNKELEKLFKRKLLVKNEYRMVRTFLNGYLAKSDPNNSPLATASWKLDISEYCEEDGTNAYHVAAKERNFEILQLISNRLVENNIGINAEANFRMTPLHVAALEPNNLEVVKFLVEEGANVNSEDENKTTPLHVAASKPNNLEVVKFLVEHKADVNSRDKVEWTPLHVAAFQPNNLEVVKFLVEHKADVNSRAEDKTTPLHVAASKPNNLEVVKFLVEHKADVNSRAKDELTPLHVAASKPNNREVVKFLVEEGANVNSKDENKTTPLHVAASKPNNLEVVKFLVEEGANVNSKDENKTTPLHVAASKPNNLEVVKFLVEHKADVNSRDKDERTPLHVAAFQPNNLEVVKFLVEHKADVNSRAEDEWTPLHVAAFQPNNLEVVKFLVERGANVNSENKNKSTPLHHVAAFQPNNLEVVKFLVEHKADVNSRDKDERTPLHMAAFQPNNLEVVKFLVERGANVNSENKNKSTPLHVAAFQPNNLEVVKFLVEHKADVNSRAKDESTPLHVAAFQPNNLEVVKFLVEEGANVNSEDENKATPLHVAASKPNNLEVVKFLVERGANVNSRDKDERTPLHVAASQPNNREVEKFLLANGADNSPGETLLLILSRTTPWLWNF